LCLWYNVRAAHGKTSGKRGLASQLADLVRNPVGRREYADGTYEMTVERPLVCFNLFHLIREMDRVPTDAKTVNLQLTDRVSIIDHTTYENLLHYMEEYNSHDEKPNLNINGLERLHSTSSDKTSIRLANGRAPVPVSSAR